MSERVFLDTSVLYRYLAEDDPSRAFAAATLIESERTLIVSGVVLLETIHALRTTAARQNPELALGLISFLSRANVELVDADRGHVVAGLRWTMESSARRIPDAILAATAAQASCDWIATFDEAFASPAVPSRLL
jgi:predicted nucleic acid-binding protein